MFALSCLAGPVGNPWRTKFYPPVCRFRFAAALCAQTSRYRGVHWDSERSKWRAKVCSNGRVIYPGRFDCEVDAALAVDKQIREVKPPGWQQRLNFPSALERSTLFAISSPIEEATGSTCIADSIAGGPWQQTRARFSSKYRGVYWHRRARKWCAMTTVHGSLRYIGLFVSQLEAAEAVDHALRRWGPANSRARLNFPSTCDMARARNVEVYGAAHTTEARAWQQILRSLHAWATSGRFEVRRLREGTHADAIFRCRDPGYDDMWVGMQVKSTARASANNTFTFNNTRGYDGLLLVCVALVPGVIWVIPGDTVGVGYLTLKVGNDMHDSFRCEDLGAALTEAWLNCSRYPKRSAAAWGTPTSRLRRIEHDGQKHGHTWLSKCGFSLEQPVVENGHFDTVINGVIRAQEKTVTAPRHDCGTYCVSLTKHGGLGTRIPYVGDEFDLLVVYLFSQWTFATVFIVPTYTLLRHGVVGAQRAGLTLYPPQSQPNARRPRTEKAWQAQYFFDVRRDLDNNSAARLLDIVTLVPPSLQIQSPQR